ncbi:hypothetical protein GLOIN_2v1572084 [Rhizophagus clarus]|uniref:Uncharacterized protein n=1 Tax=Rhizophagus clarus TaxID=94130 RepID=A0A8H3QZJ0_9GLOM|nr:hypothetical protein GLOIN_2v1572084 [Rhizophagus clarus]
MYGRKSEKFLWAVTRGQITLSALKTRLWTCFAFLNGTEDEHIVIIRDSGKEHVRLVDNEVLACIIWTQGFKVDIPIIMDTCRCNGDFFYEIYTTDSNRFNLGVSTAQQPFSFDGGFVDASDYKKRGVGQNAIPLQASSHHNKKKRTYNEALRKDVMYGIVSTGVNWIIIKLVTTGKYNDSDNWNVAVLLSSRTPFTFPINESVFDKFLCLENSRTCSGESRKKMPESPDAENVEFKAKINTVAKYTRCTRRDVENIRCDAENVELKVRVAKLEEDSRQPQKDSFSKKPANIPDPIITNDTVPAYSKSSEEKMINTFLNEANKKGLAMRLGREDKQVSIDKRVLHKENQEKQREKFIQEMSKNDSSTNYSNTIEAIICYCQFGKVLIQRQDEIASEKQVNPESNAISRILNMEIRAQLPADTSDVLYGKNQAAQETLKAL